MTIETGTCKKCGGTSCISNCSTENTSINGITDELCTSKTIEQIEAEADAFMKMDVYKKISSIKEMDTGYEIVYENPSPTFTLELIDFLKLEVKCCPTYNYALVVDNTTQNIHYQRYGSLKIKEELREYFKIIGLI